MKLTCSQMEILLAFYIEDELSSCLKQQVEEHLEECESCANKYKIIHDMVNDMKKSFTRVSKSCGIGDTTNIEDNESEHFGLFKTKLSAYMDNELNDDENLKVKKYAISNKSARKELEDSYNIRKLMKESFKRAKSDAKTDYTKNVIQKLSPDDEKNLEFSPAILLLITFTISVLVISTVILLMLRV